MGEQDKEMLIQMKLDEQVIRSSSRQQINLKVSEFQLDSRSQAQYQIPQSMAVVSSSQEPTNYTMGTLRSADVLSLLTFLPGITVVGKAIS